MRVYLDHNASTPVDARVLAAMLPGLQGTGANPSALHSAGQAARRAVDLAREQVAAVIGARPEEVTFGSGGTEALNTALRGLARPGTRLVTTAVEHRSVLTTAAELERGGVEVVRVGVGVDGVVDPDAVEAALDERTALVAVMLANNETGAMQPVARIAAAARARGIPVLCDAVQAAGKVPVDVGELGVDLLALSAHKLYGPKGAGALWVRRGLSLSPLLTGGTQERRRRAGTEAVPAIVGMGEACALAAEGLHVDQVRALRDALEREVLAALPDAVVSAASAPRLPNTLHLCLAGLRGEDLVMALDLEGVCASSGAACAASVSGPSHVLVAMGVDEALARGAVRLSLGRSTTSAEVEHAARALIRVVARLRGPR